MSKREPGFFCIDNSFFKRYSSVMGPYGYMVYSSLLSYADQAGECFPKQSTIAKATGISERKVRDSLLHLENEGFIRSEFRGNGRSNVYYIVPESEFDRHDMPESNDESHEEPAQYAAQTQETEAPHAGHDATPAQYADKDGTVCLSQPAQYAGPIKEQDPIEQNTREQDFSFSSNGNCVSNSNDPPISESTYLQSGDERYAKLRPAWDIAVQENRDSLSRGAPDWLEHTSFASIREDGSAFVYAVLVEDATAMDAIRGRMGHWLERTISSVIGKPARVEFHEGWI